jgi:small subunit ribosomal protein S9
MEKFVCVGRRKRAIARVYLQPGSGKFEINSKNMRDFFPQILLQIKVLEPFEVLSKAAESYDVFVRVEGGGITGQAEAIRLGISRALVEQEGDNRSPLKKAGFLTRDSRKVERKKFGKHKARKGTQFSKR